MEAEAGIWDGVDAVRELSLLQVFFPPALFSRGFACHYLDTFLDEPKHEHLYKFFVFFSLYYAQLNSGIDSTRIRKAKSRYYLILSAER